ncbi:hypothetical protein [Streptomyces sp. AC627_RSS907]|uniref:hypothetical protein n=1 Tax=Streptomyces sp. AC627_RSS907 TaxID=2823684 RepID=UPI001C254E9D|nr:hypothetical protein [Streptomyces sp. AC627_RSS907]
MIQSPHHALRYCTGRTAAREAAFHDRARPNWRITVATTTLHQLTRDGADRPVWRVVGHGEGRRALTALPKPR